jgi:hypothetical protein
MSHTPLASADHVLGQALTVKVWFWGNFVVFFLVNRICALVFSAGISPDKMVQKRPLLQPQPPRLVFP